MHTKVHRLENQPFFDPTEDGDSESLQPANGRRQDRVEPASSNIPAGLDPTLLEPEVLERAHTIPSSWYTESTFHEFDRTAIFSKTWQYVAHESRIPDRGDFLTDTVAGNPVIVIRNEQGKLTAFYNVCRHRGGPLAMEACGNSRMLQCKYHGWTYKTDGSLRGVPRFNRTDLFDKKDFGLVPIQVGVWEGLIFVCLSPDQAPDLDDVVAGIRARIHPVDLSALRYHGQQSYHVSCNWKVYVDNFLEGYHIPLVHPDLCDLLDVRSYVTETAPWYSLQYSPLLDGNNLYGASDGEAWYYFVYPNFMMNILPGRLQVNRVIATSKNTCRVIFDYYYADLESEEAKQMIAEDHRFADQVQDEDIRICEHVQRGLQSNAYDRGRFSVDAEAGVHHFQDLLKRSYRSAIGPGHLPASDCV